MNLPYHLDGEELVALLRLSSWCFVTVVWLFLAVPRLCLQLVIVVFTLSYSLTIFDKMPGLVWILTVQRVNACKINRPKTMLHVNALLR